MYGSVFVHCNLNGWVLFIPVLVVCFLLVQSCSLFLKQMSIVFVCKLPCVDWKQGTPNLTVDIMFPIRKSTMLSDIVRQIRTLISFSSYFRLLDLPDSVGHSPFESASGLRTAEIWYTAYFQTRLFHMMGYTYIYIYISHIPLDPSMPHCIPSEMGQWFLSLDNKHFFWTWFPECWTPRHLGPKNG